MGRLHYAARRGMLDVLEAALASGEPVDARTTDGSTPLHLAAKEGFGRLVERLLNAGADAMAIDSHGSTALHLAARSGMLPIVQRLIDAGMTVDTKDHWGETPALEAARTGRQDVVAFLLHRGANPLVREREGGHSVEEWLAVGGLLGLHNRVVPQTPGCGSVGVAFVRKMMEQASTVEEYAAHHARQTYLFSYGAMDLPDPEVDRWAKRYAEILRIPALLAECEERYLKGEDLDRARKIRVRRERSVARWKIRQERVRLERKATLPTAVE